MKKTETVPLSDPNYLFQTMARRMSGKPEMQQRVNAHVARVTKGQHAEIGDFHNNGASDEEKVALYKAVLTAILPEPPNYGLLEAPGSATEQGTTITPQPALESAPAVKPEPKALAVKTPAEELAEAITRVSPNEGFSIDPVDGSISWSHKHDAKECAVCSVGHGIMVSVK